MTGLRVSDIQHLPTYLFKRKSIYYYRIRLPRSMCAFCRRNEIKVSLRTSYIRLAKKRAEEISTVISDLIREFSSNPMSFSEERLKEALQIHFNEQLNNDEVYRRDKRRTWDDVDLEQAVISDYIERYTEALQLNQYKGFEPEVDRLATELELSITKGTPEYNFLCREYAKSQITLHEAILRRVDGDYSMEQFTYGEPNKSSETKSETSLLTFRGIVKRYVAEVDLSNQWTAKTREENLKIFDLFCQIVGDIALNELNHDVVVAYKEVLIKLPPHINTKPEYRSKSVSEILEMPDLPRMSVATINKNLNRISVLFRWATTHGMLSQNFAQGMALKKDKRADEEKQAYTTAELEVIFGSSIYTEMEFDKPFKFWLPLLGLFTGARLNELCQLYLSDIREDEKGTWYLDINSDTDDKRLKSLASGRQVALHAAILDAGILDYVKELKARGETRLFPELKHHRDGYGKQATKWYTSLRRKLGIYRKGLDFHSFRHTLSHQLYAKGTPLEVVGEILGHDDGRVTKRYAKRLNSSSQLEHLQKIDIGIDISHINFHKLSAR